MDERMAYYDKEHYTIDIITNSTTCIDAWSEGGESVHIEMTHKQAIRLMKDLRHALSEQYAQEAGKYVTECGMNMD